jgi:SEC-C motif-containing protein
MRSRFAAFALGLGDYLVDTLASDHPDRSAPRERLVRELAGAHHQQRFLGLRIVHTSTDGAEGSVLFYARIFERGVDRSFAELSSFVHEGGAWRYRSGELLSRDAFPCEPEALTLDVFRTAMEES